ncbi:MAG: competence/damage-inducible protein A [Candidatus Solibacter usitatus]|nr:competence/damage-inducible protein A [Candidatus Solibacter usitatus]
MNAEIIAVGSELLTPQRSDTNSLWLTARLNELGVEVIQKSILGDDRDRLAEAVRASLSRVPLVVLTGGLGPTEDDVTREAVAQALHRRLLFSREICDWIEARFTRLGRKMAEINKRQAFLVEGAERLENPNGTAPGQWLDLPGGMVLLLPGPPREMQPLFEKECLPLLRERLPQLHIATRCYRVAGMGESDLDALIAPIYKLYANPVATILAAEGDVQIHLRARCESPAEAEALAGEVGAKILGALGNRVYSTGGEPLEAVVGALLQQRGATLSVAESCTAGLLGARITEVAGASNWFLGGFQVYGTPMKTRLLGLDENLVSRNGVVSEAVAVAMAESVRDRTGSTYALSITGEAGPESSTPGVDPGTVWIGIASPAGAQARMFRFPNGRARVRNFAVQTALNLLRLQLLP